MDVQDRVSNGTGTGTGTEGGQTDGFTDIQKEAQALEDGEKTRVALQVKQQKAVEPDRRFSCIKHGDGK